jgi:UDP-N-acetylmuramate dehydrogenase
MDMANLMQIETAGLRGAYKRNEPMHTHVSWRAGGAVDRAYAPADLDDLSVFLRRLPRHEPILFVGLGSNLLIRDGGFRGTVVFTHRALAGLLLENDSSRPEIYAEAGVATPKVARFAANHDMERAEFLAGIPGTVGGVLAMNAGCYGSETWDVVVRVRTIDRAGKLYVREPYEYNVAYRSVLAVHPHDEFFVAAWFGFVRGDGDRARQRIRELLAKRIATQPLGEPNAGSVFRNPPHDYAARLIEASGLKGSRIGGAVVSPIHANFIVNKGGATASDIEELIVLIQTTVHRTAGVTLEREVQIVGEALKAQHEHN